jgi:single-stranded DNA-binding protein
MNQVRIVGTIVDEIELRRRPDGSETASVALRFSEANGTILLFCMGERTRHLAKFRPGDAVKIFGRLSVNKQNHKAAIIVEEAQHLNKQHESAKDREADEWNTARKFQQHAKVAGDHRWATRPGVR